MRRHLSYANVTATFALVVALATGGAYAADLIGSDEIRDNSIRSEDLRDRRAVSAKDVKRNKLGSREIDEASLDASGFADLRGEQTTDCDVGSSPTTCAATPVRLMRRGRIAAIATGAFFSSAELPANATCDIRFDGVPAAIDQEPGDPTGDTDSANTNGFARTAVSDLLPRGMHEVSLACEMITGEAEIGTPTIIGLGLNSR